MTTNKGEYVPVAKSAVKSTALGFGSVGASNDGAVLASAKGTIPAVTVVHDDSHYPVYSGGTENYFGPIITLGHNETINNTANLAIQVAGNASSPEYHTRKEGRVHGVTAIDILTGDVTYETLQGSGYTLNSSGGTRDTVVDAVTDPYNVPARLTHLGGKAPVSSSYNPLTEGV
jgi:hypothetical protein